MEVFDLVFPTFSFLSDGVLFREIKSTGKEDKHHRRIPVPECQRAGQSGKTCTGSCIMPSCSCYIVSHKHVDISDSIVCVSGGDESGSGSYPAWASAGCWTPLCHGSDYPAL